MSTISFDIPQDMRHWAPIGQSRAAWFHDKITNGSLVASSSAWEITEADDLGYDDIRGTALGGESDNMPTLGTVTSWLYTVDATGSGSNDVQWSFSDFSMAASTFSQYVLRGDITQLLADYIMADADTVTGSYGSDYLLGYGGDDRLYGGDGRDVLDGGLGADIMAGGDGNDWYVIDDARDRAIEDNANGGTDTIRSSVSVTLAANLENLTLVGTAALNGRGNALANVIKGNEGKNSLHGYDGDDTLSGGASNDQIYGGLGVDRLTGGEGADRFVFDTAFGSGNHDNILDFNVADDSIVLDRSIFTAFSSDGRLVQSAFFTGSGAHDADDRIIYNDGNGNIYYDPDGSGPATQVMIAHVTPGLELTNADFLIVG